MDHNSEGSLLLEVSPLPFLFARTLPRCRGIYKTSRLCPWSPHHPLVETLFLLVSSHWRWSSLNPFMWLGLFVQCLSCLIWLAWTGLDFDIWLGKLYKLQFLTLNRICFHDETTFCLSFLSYQPIDQIVCFLSQSFFFFFIKIDFMFSMFCSHPRFLQVSLWTECTYYNMYFFNFIEVYLTYSIV